VKAYLASGAAGRIHLEPFPSYAPELNPDEGIWNYLKRVELKNVGVKTSPTCARTSARPKSAWGTSPVLSWAVPNSLAFIRYLLKDQ